MALLGAVLAIVLLLSIRPLRERLLPFALARLDAALPGDLQVQRARWPALGSIVVAGVRWTAGDTTLVTADELAIRVTLGAFVHGDVTIESLALRGLRGDLPALQRLLTARAGKAGEKSEARRFPRAGSLPGLPSIAIDTLHVDAARLQITAGTSVTALWLDATVDVRHGMVPRLRVDRATVQGPPEGWRVDSLALDVDLARGQPTGHGAGRITPLWPLRLDLTSDAPDRIALRLSESAETVPPAAMGVVALATVARRGLAVDSLAFTATVRTPGTRELARVPALATRLRDRPAASGLQFDASGTLVFGSDPELRLHAAFAPGDLVGAGKLFLRRRDTRWDVRCDTLEVADVCLRGNVQGDPDSLAASLSLDVNGPRWQDWLRARRGPAWTLRSHVDYHRRRGAAMAALRLVGSGVLSGHSVDRLRLDGTLGIGPRAPSAFQLLLLSHGVHAGVAGEIRRGDTLAVRLSPLRLQTSDAGLTRVAVPERQAATLRYVPAAGRIRLTNFQIRGDAGDADVRADFASQTGGTLAARLAWPRFPTLLAAMAGLAPALAESLRVHWVSATAPASDESLDNRRSSDAPTDLDGSVQTSRLPEAPPALALDVTAGPGLNHVTGTGMFSLPGPGDLAPLVPGMQVDDLGALTGTFRFETAAVANTRRYDLQLDGSPTAWIDTLLVHVSGTSDRLQVQRATLAAEDLHLTLGGGFARDALDLRARWDLRGPAIILRLLQRSGRDSLSPIARLELRGDVHLSGSRAHPALVAKTSGRLAGWGVRAPALQATLARDSTGLHGHLALPQGLGSPWLALESARVEVHSARTQGWIPQLLVLDATGRDFALHESARVDVGESWRAAVDTFRVVLAGKDLEATHPFAVSYAKDRLRVDALALAGSLGTLDAAGIAGSDSTRFGARIALDLPECPASLLVPPDFWPRRVRVDLQAASPDSPPAAGDDILPAAGTDSLCAAIEIQGFRLAGGMQPLLRADFRTQGKNMTAKASLADTASMFTGQATLPLRLQLWPPRATVLDGAVAADLRFARLPFGMHTTRTRGALGPEDLGRLQGQVTLGGTAAALAAFADINVRFPDAPNLAPFVFAVRARAGSDARVDSLWQSAAPGAGLSSAPEDVVVVFSLLSNVLPLVHGDATVPLRLGLGRPFTRTDSTRALAIHLRADDLPLATWSPLLPRGAALTGTTTFKVDVDGNLLNPRLDGSLSTSEVTMSLGKGSYVVFVTRGQLGGERRRPSLRGDIEVKEATIKVPEAQKDLLPSSGEALLQRPGPAAPATGMAFDTGAAVDTSAALDTKAAAASDVAVAADSSVSSDALRAPTPPALAHTDLDIRIRVPRALWVRGHGLDIEGKGEIQITQVNARPVVAGALQGIRGTFSIAGRTLVLDHGTVTFHNDDTVNPTLDIQLSTTISSTKIRVLVSGTAAAPELTLSSDPEMEQSDIIALLALGKTYDEISDTESNLMRERATAMLVSRGAMVLQNNVPKKFGIDIVQYRSSTGAPGAKSSDEASAGSLAFGMYLSPKLLLSYSYSLDHDIEHIMSLEYFLKGQLTIETLYSAKGQSGLGFGWTKEY